VRRGVLVIFERGKAAAVVVNRRKQHAYVIAQFAPDADKGRSLTVHFLADSL
jgi:hypothetical protein